MYSSDTETIKNAIAAAQQNNTLAYEVYIKINRKRTIAQISFATNPGMLMDYWNSARLVEYGLKAYVVGFVALC